VNGSFGVDVATEPKRLPELSAKLPVTGVTSYPPTVTSSPANACPKILAALDFGGAGAEALGVHLEGPLISPGKRGAHAPENVIPSDPGLLSDLLSVEPVRLLTLAPELRDAEALIGLCAERGTRVSAGHSGASFPEASRAFAEGVRCVTHLFNAMSPLHRRDPGLPGAAFSSDRAVCGIIADGRHVHLEMVRLAYRLLGPERLYLTTDAISAAGAGPGEFTLAGRPTSISGGLPRLASGEMSGSLRTMDEAFRNILSFTGCTVAEAAKMAATTAADLIGAGDRKGRLALGYDADVVARSPEVETVWKVRRANEPVALPQALKKAPTMAEARMAAQPMPVSVEEPARRLTSTSNTPSTSNILATGLSDRMPLFAPLFIPLLT
jgi:N-acetylglucosamine-6-phosphate deacetylase